MAVEAPRETYKHNIWNYLEMMSGVIDQAYKDFEIKDKKIVNELKNHMYIIEMTMSEKPKMNGVTKLNSPVEEVSTILEGMESTIIQARKNLKISDDFADIFVGWITAIKNEIRTMQK